jgi:hypothetical protein
MNLILKEISVPHKKLSVQLQQQEPNHLFWFVTYNRDIEIARRQEPKHISQLAAEIGLYPNEVLQYGPKKAKIDLSVLKRLKNQKSGKYIVVAGYVLYCLRTIVSVSYNFVLV